MEQRQWHALSSEEVLEVMDTNHQGLSSKEAEARSAEFGRNVLPEKKKKSFITRFLKHFNDVLIYVLLFAALITGFLGHFLDMTVIILVAFINAVIGYVQENRAEKALDSIRNMMTTTAVVLRNGRSTEIPGEDVVPGDIILLSSGEKIPADMRLIEVNNLKIEESALTGESIPVSKSVKAISEETVLAERENMAFSSSSITSGTGRGVVIATGSHTELGKINASMEATEQLSTPLMDQTAIFGKQVSIGIIFLSVAIFLFGWLYHGYHPGELILSVIALAVGAIPEGLPAVISIILALGVQNMARKKSIVKNLPSVETLGSVSVICTDKTGTLTKNEMTVTDIILEEAEYKVTGTGYEPVGDIKPISNHSHDDALESFLTCVKTVNEARLHKDEGAYTIIGEPTEGCLMTLAYKADFDVSRLPAIDKIPFDSEYKYMAYLVPYYDKKRILIKGAPDRLFERAWNRNQKIDQWNASVSRLASEGKRLIAAGYKDMPPHTQSITHEDLKDGIHMLGIAGIIDPPKQSSIIAVEECQEAGIRVKMITGDHQETAVAIGKSLNIGDGVHAMTGRQLDLMSEDELYHAAHQYDVFARTSPENKLQLVQALQKHDEIVSMTGDGINDAPALKRADIGVAMGIKGTEVSKDAARMILVDDNFETIVDAVKEGRRVYDNLKKTILFILPTNGSQGLLILAAILFGISIPLTPVQVLWVNMVTAVTISFALAFEPLDPETMMKPPRPKKTPLLSSYFIFRISLVSILVAGSILLANLYLKPFVSHDLLNTLTLHSLVFALIFHLFNCRSIEQFALTKDFFKNKTAFGISALLFLLQIIITYVPFFNQILKTSPMPIKYWLVPVGIGAFIFTVIEIEKWMTRTLMNKNRKKRL